MSHRAVSIGIYSDYPLRTIADPGGSLKARVLHDAHRPSLSHALSRQIRPGPASKPRGRTYACSLNAGVHAGIPIVVEDLDTTAGHSSDNPIIIDA